MTNAYYAYSHWGAIAAFFCILLVRSRACNLLIVSLPEAISRTEF
ncbi:MAG: hypothetical protein V7K41_25950 [Nostoc sp.]